MKNLGFAAIAAWALVCLGGCGDSVHLSGDVDGEPVAECLVDADCKRTSCQVNAKCAFGECSVNSLPDNTPCKAPNGDDGVCIDATCTRPQDLCEAICPVIDCQKPVECPSAVACKYAPREAFAECSGGICVGNDEHRECHRSCDRDEECLPKGLPGKPETNPPPNPCKQYLCGEVEDVAASGTVSFSPPVCDRPNQPDGLACTVLVPILGDDGLPISGPDGKPLTGDCDGLCLSGTCAIDNAEYAACTAH